MSNVLRFQWRFDDTADIKGDGVALEGGYNRGVFFFRALPILVLGVVFAQWFGQAQRDELNLSLLFSWGIGLALFLRTPNRIGVSLAVLVAVVAAGLAPFAGSPVLRGADSLGSDPSREIAQALKRFPSLVRVIVPRPVPPLVPRWGSALGPSTELWHPGIRLVSFGYEGHLEKSELAPIRRRGTCELHLTFPRRVICLGLRSKTKEAFAFERGGTLYLIGGHRARNILRRRGTKWQKLSSLDY